MFRSICASLICVFINFQPCCHWVLWKILSTSFFLHCVLPILTPCVSSSQSFENVNCVVLDSTQAKVDLKNNNKCTKKMKWISFPKHMGSKWPWAIHLWYVLMVRCIRWNAKFIIKLKGKWKHTKPLKNYSHKYNNFTIKFFDNIWTSHFIFSCFKYIWLALDLI